MNGKHYNQMQWTAFTKPNDVPKNSGMHDGNTNVAFVPDEPLVLNPVQVQVKPEKNNFVRYAEVEEVHLEEIPPTVHEGMRYLFI